MGKHSAARDALQNIDRLEPASESGETLRDAQKRQREVRRSPAELARRRQRTKRVAMGCLFTFVLLLVAGLIGAYAYTQYVNRKIADASEQKNPDLAKQLANEAPRAPGEPFYMLLLGEDKRPGEVRARSDTIIVAYVDPPRKRINLLSIPRDARVSIPGHGKNKINSAMQIGGATLVKDTVKDLTGLPISHYMEVDFNGFKDLVDAVGGVWVDVPQRIVDSKAANHDWRAKVVPKGYQRLDGAHALTFVRARHLEGDDWTRMKDQQIFIKALAKQTLTVGNVVKIPQIVNALFSKDAVTTSLSVPQLLSLAEDFKGAGDGGVAAATVPGTPKYISGISYVILDKPGMMEQVRRIEAGESLESTPAAALQASVAATSVSVTVRNGAGQAGLAAEVANLLKKEKFRMGEVGNTARPVYDHTLVVFKTNDAKARLVHDTLGFGTVVRTSSLYQFKTDILVIVGKDWRKEFPKAKS